MATDTCTKFGENSMCRFADMLADRHTDMLITIQCFLRGVGGVIVCHNQNRNKILTEQNRLCL